MVIHAPPSPSIQSCILCSPLSSPAPDSVRACRVRWCCGICTSSRLDFSFPRLGPITLGGYFWCGKEDYPDGSKVLLKDGISRIYKVVNVFPFVLCSCYPTCNIRVQVYIVLILLLPTQQSIFRLKFVLQWLLDTWRENDLLSCLYCSKSAPFSACLALSTYSEPQSSTHNNMCLDERGRDSPVISRSEASGFISSNNAIHFIIVFSKS